MSPDFFRIRRELFEKGTLFEDKEFEPEKANLFYHQPPAGVTFEWKRPREIFKNPQFVIDDPKEYDIVPGKYGHSWFASALAVLYQYRGLFYRAVPADQGFSPELEYAGIFHFRFWWAGDWVEVVVDDRLPCIDSAPAFLTSHSSNQLWASLLEKAYAKLHGSYEALGYTRSGDILCELSGGATEVLPVSLPALHAALKLTVIPTAVPDIGKKLDNGIVPGRNYCIAAIDQVKSGTESMSLVKLRLPPALPPCTGPWATTQRSEWSRFKEAKEELNVEREISNGFFWMSVPEFERTFNRLELVYLDAETCESEGQFLTSNVSPPHTRVLRGSWVRGATAGGCKYHPETFHINPQFLLRTTVDGSPLMISLLQYQNQEPRVMGFSIYKVPAEYGGKGTVASNFFKTTKAVHHSTFSNGRQVSESYSLPKGSFLLVPSTYDVGQEGHFVIRIYSQSPLNLTLLDNLPGISKSPIVPASSELPDYRKQFDSFADERKTINAFELQELLHSCLPNDYMKSSATMDVCRKVIQAFQTTPDRIGRLAFVPFQDFIWSLKVWQEIFGFYSKTTSGVIKAEKLRDALSDVGFDLSTETLQRLIFRYMRRDGTLRFGDFVACILHLIAAFNLFRKDCKTGEVSLTNAEWMKAILSC